MKRVAVLVMRGSIAEKRHHEQDNLKMKEFTWGLLTVSEG